MKSDLLDYLCDPMTGAPLRLEAKTLAGDEIIEGALIAPSGRCYPIRNGIPRFVEAEQFATVESFGDQWTHFNFIEQKQHWLEHTIANTFGSTDVFRDRIVVDAGGGSGAQSLWMLENGAKRVILLELSQSVDDVVARNIPPDMRARLDVIQCSIDQPPLKAASIDGIVICHNVIQHTQSVEATARALFDIVAPGGEFVFNCYRRGRMNVMNFIRGYLTYGPMRALMRQMPFSVTLFYSRLMGMLRLVPILGWLNNKLRLSLTGKVPRIEGESWLARQQRIYRLTALNTFDTYGSHAYQHHLSEAEQRTIIEALQPDRSKVLNLEAYFATPQPTGCAIRIGK
jgi:uncharacterized protein YbaR (Trm112 family)